MLSVVVGDLWRVCMSVHVSVRISEHLSVCLLVSVAFCMSACLYVCLMNPINLASILFLFESLNLNAEIFPLSSAPLLVLNFRLLLLVVCYGDINEDVMSNGWFVRNATFWKT